MIIIQGNKAKYWLGILASIFLGMTFIVAGSGKWFSGVVEVELIVPLAFLSFYPPEVVSACLMLGELLIGILLVVGLYTKCAASFSLLLIAGFITNNILLIASGLGGEPCNCFGMGQQLSVMDSLWLDGIMVMWAVTVLCWYPARFFEARPWFWRK